MKILSIDKKKIERYNREFVNKCRNITFSYNYKWTEQWADKPLIKGKSFKELLVWKKHSLWYFYEYFIRDTYGYDGIPFLPFSGIMFKIDLYTWIIEKEKPEKICVNEIDPVDVQILKELCKKKKVSFKINSLKINKRKLRENKFLVRNFIKTRLFLRWLISKAHRKDSSKKDALILTNDRHSSRREDDDAFFGSIIKELKKEKISFRTIEYDRPHSPDNITKAFKKYFLKKTSSNFIGDYYTLGTLNKIFKTAKEFGKLGREIVNKKEFKESLTYQGINFYPFVKERLDFMFEVLNYYVADVLIITEEILKKENPKVVLLEHEKNFYNKGIIINAKKRNIKTFCFEGELVYERNIYLKSTKTKEINNPKSPLWRPLPDLKFMWGNYSKNWFIKNAHYPPGILKVIGAPKYDYLLNEFKSLNRKDLLKRYGLKNKKTVLILTCVVWADELLYASLSSLQEKDVQIVIKLHPEDNKSEMTNLIKKMCRKFRVNMPLILKYADFNELLAISDLVITYQSTLVYDVLLSDKQVVVLNPHMEFNISLPCITEKIVPVVEDKKMLKKMINNVLENTHRSSVKYKKRFINEHLYLQDGKASFRAVQIIRGDLK